MENRRGMNKQTGNQHSSDPRNLFSLSLGNFTYSCCYQLINSSSILALLFYSPSSLQHRQLQAEEVPGDLAASSASFSGTSSILSMTSGPSAPCSHCILSMELPMLWPFPSAPPNTLLHSVSLFYIHTMVSASELGLITPPSADKAHTTIDTTTVLTLVPYFPTIYTANRFTYLWKSPTSALTQAPPVCPSS